MKWSLIVALGGLVTVAGCGGGSSPKAHLPDAAAIDSELDGGTPGDGIAVGDPVDTNGDGVADGVAVDTNGDGVSDGVDTNADGVVDQPLPTSDAGRAAPVTTAPYPVDATGAVLCGGIPCACSDGLDNDKDGLTDLLDPECVATWDNDEGSLATGIPGDNRDDACQDCFFDGNSGSGDDGCRLPSSCLTLGNASSGHGSCDTCEQSAQCKKFCQAYTPNGCDCFGCCDIKVGDAFKHVMLSASCSIDGTTLTNCTECVPSTTCVNTCGTCELCPGKTLNDLPAECFPPQTGSDAGTAASGDGGAAASDGGTGGAPPLPAYTCDHGEALCGAGQPPCATGALCEFGCCVLSPLLF